MSRCCLCEMSNDGSSVQAFLKEQSIGFKSQKAYYIGRFKSTHLIALKVKLTFSYKKNAGLKSCNTCFSKNNFTRTKEPVFHKYHLT